MTETQNSVMSLNLEKTIGLNPQFSAHITDELELLLLSEQSSFRLSGKLYLAVLPYLNGKHSASEIVEIFKTRVPSERAEFRSRSANRYSSVLREPQHLQGNPQGR